MEVTKTDLYYIEFIKENPEFTGCVIDKNGNKYWFLNGKEHRTDGPACEWANGNKYWYLNGELHRTDGPAIERADGSKSWFLNGDELTEEEYEVKIRELLLSNDNPKEETISQLTQIWKTSDDTIHDTKEQALQHQASINFSDWYNTKGNKLPRVSDENYQNHLIKNKEQILKLLSFYK